MRRGLRLRAGRRQPLAAEAEVLAELRRLRARVPAVTRAVAVRADGLVLTDEGRAGADSGQDADRLAPLTEALFHAAARMTDAAGHGGVHELLVCGEHGYVAAYTAGPSAVLTLLAEPGVAVGRLHLEARRAAAHIAELIDGRPDGPAPG